VRARRAPPRRPDIRAGPQGGTYIGAVIEVFNALLPLALLVALGAALLRLGFFDDAFRKRLDRFVYWVSLPALLVWVLSEAPDGGGSAWAMIGAMCGATLGLAAAGGAAAWALRLPPASKGVFTQAAFRGNLAFVGLPVITLASGSDTHVLAKAALVLAPTVVLFNVLGVLVLVAAQHRLSADLPLRMLKSLTTNPLLLACVAGLALWHFELRLPRAAATTLELLGKPAAPLALVSLGGALVTHPMGRHFGAAAYCAVLKCFGTPALAWLIAGWLGLPATDRQVVLILAATPTAVASYVLATQLKGDEGMAATTIVFSTLLSAVALGTVLALG